MSSHHHSHSHEHEQGGPHRHHESHRHSHGHTSFEDANKQYFNETAHTYNDRPEAHERARRLSAAMRKAYDFDEGTTVVMDYACGTGLISKELAPYAKSIVGIDISQKMVDQYNQSVSYQGIEPDEMKAICAEIKGEPDELGGSKFDVIVCASSYHHFISVEDVTRIIVSHLKFGGSLLVADLMKEESTVDIFPSETHHLVAHRGGFSEQEMRTLFENAGLRNFSFETATEAKHFGHPVKLFLAKGDKVDI
ncbi:S-adenosyl-L-methionine-dependent methyltransferase [Hygrophoropsis aurantiaca]|uniref:S-adenosyl-L-methionine-dependent methyltransferase n=1 Tax=Hygrophoropsis aurantiaca TaxID=72124 RepID=A0ACB8AFC1_9AGAM|nr:S-adenosyl-L-methionine-dependent methyltransferase [Hygrophoropsis aurantiaca]